jgi:hypothetical protein
MNTQNFGMDLVVNPSPICPQLPPPDFEMSLVSASFPLLLPVLGLCLSCQLSSYSVDSFWSSPFPWTPPFNTSINPCGQLSWTLAHPLQASSLFLSLTFLGPLHLQCLHSPSAHLLFQSRHHLTFLQASAALGGWWSSPCFHEYTGFSSLICGRLLGKLRETRGTTGVCLTAGAAKGLGPYVAVLRCKIQIAGCRVGPSLWQRCPSPPDQSSTSYFPSWVMLGIWCMKQEWH